MKCLDKAINNTTEGITKYEAEETVEQPLSSYLTSEESEYVKLNLMHNHNGFAKEIRHLRLNLEEQTNEQTFLKHDIERLNAELKEIESFDEHSNSQYFEHESNISQFNRRIDTNKYKLKQLVIANIKLNEEVYGSFKTMKIIEAQLIKLSSDQINSEKKFYIEQLKKMLKELSK